MRFALSLSVLLLTAVVTQNVEAGYTYGFTGLSKNNVNNVVTGESQLTVHVRRYSSGYVRFRFDNQGSNAASLTDVYFDDPSKLFRSWTATSGSSGVSFSKDSVPGDLDGGNLLTPAFDTDVSYSSSSTANGVNPGERLYVWRRLKSNKRFWHVVSAIAGSTLRIGLDVDGFESGGNESFINSLPGGGKPPMVPEPGGLALAGIGLFSLLVTRRGYRRRKGVHST